MTNRKWRKDDAHLIPHIDSLETPAEYHHSFITPNRHFFVCNDSRTPAMALDDYTLKIGGDAVEQPLALSYDALLKLPSHTLIAYLECAGSQRNLFKEVMGQQATSDTFAMTPWMLGGVGNAVWTGVRLKTLLDMAGLKPEAAWVNGKGLDADSAEGGVSRPMPIEKALHPDTMVAYFMNGEPLPPDHGFPLRLLVPGWIGTHSVKWLGEVMVSAEKPLVNRNTKHYVYIGPEWPAEQHAPALGGEMYAQTIKSSLALAWNAELPAGPQMIRGVARSPEAEITCVEWSADGGATWQNATLIQPILRFAWVRFEFEWDAPAGAQTIMTRATDANGNTQPMEHPFNKEGYLFNRVYPHPIRVLD